MNIIRIKVTPKQIIESLIICFEELKEKSNNKNRYTKFDSDNDSFLGPLGEKAFFSFLEKSGYIYKKDFIDNKCLDKEDITEINGKEYDHYDFKIKYGEEYHTIDLKTQYCMSLNLYNEYWQMAVNAKTIEKIKLNKRKLDYFVFIFSDKKFIDYKKYIEDKLNTDNIDKILEWLNSKLDKAEKCFKEFEIDITGMIKTDLFISCSQNTYFPS